MTDGYSDGDRVRHITGDVGTFRRYSEDLGTTTAVVVFDGDDKFATHVPLSDIHPA